MSLSVATFEAPIYEGVADECGRGHSGVTHSSLISITLVFVLSDEFFVSRSVPNPGHYHPVAAVCLSVCLSFVLSVCL